MVVFAVVEAPLSVPLIKKCLSFCDVVFYHFFPFLFPLFSFYVSSFDFKFMSEYGYGCFCFLLSSKINNFLVYTTYDLNI